MDSETIRAVMRELGSRGGKVGGKIGGKRRLQTLTAERRSEIARAAGVASAKARAEKKADATAGKRKASKKITPKRK